MDRLSDSLAVGLLSLGLKAGDRIGIWISNRWEWVVTQIAAAKSDLILVTINPAYRSSEFHYAAKLVHLRALILQWKLKQSDYRDIFDGAGNVPSLEFLIEVGDSVRDGWISFNQLIQKNFSPPASVPSAISDPHASCNIQFTSGTTGHPKGTTLSHHNIINNAYFHAERMRLTQADVLVGCHSHTYAHAHTHTHTHTSALPHPRTPTYTSAFSLTHSLPSLPLRSPLFPCTIALDVS